MAENFRSYFNRKTEAGTIPVNGKILVQTDADEPQKIDSNLFTAAGGYAGTANDLDTSISAIASGFQGTLLIADTPTLDGYYTPTQAGTYPNAGGLVYSPSTTDLGFQVTFIKSGATWTKNRVDLNITLDPLPVLGSSNPVQSGGLFTEFRNILTGVDSNFSSSSINWTGAGSGFTFDSNTTIANKLFLQYTTGNQNIRIQGLEVGEWYTVNFKMKLESGVGGFINVANRGLAGGTRNKINPNSTNNEYNITFKADYTYFLFDVASADNTGSSYSVENITIYDLNPQELKEIDFSDLKTWGAIGDGVHNDTKALQALITYNSENSITDYQIKFKNGTFLLTTLITITNFDNLEIIGENAIVKSGILDATPKFLFSIANGKNLKIKDLKIDVNNDPKLFYALRCLSLSGVFTANGIEIYNFNNITQVGLYVQNITKNPSLSLANSLPSALIIGCKFYNNQVVNIPNYDYTTSAFKGIGIELDSLAEYVQIIGCNFYGLSTAVNSKGGANSTINACVFEQCDPSQKSLTNGVVNIQAGTNNGKITISDCKFNHNFGYSLYCDYSVADRGNIISNNYFIVNSITPIILKQSDNIVLGNIINRNNEQQSLTGFPYTVDSGVGVEIQNGQRNIIQSNYFNDDMLNAVKSIGTSNFNLVKDNTFRGLTVDLDLIDAAPIVRNNDSI